jgi:Tfp pilus assembly protein PilO
MILSKLQQVIIAIVIVILAGVIAYFLVYSDTLRQTASLETKITELELKIGNAKRIRDSAKELKEQMIHLKDQLNKLKKILPVKINKPKFFQNIRRMANEQGLEVVNAGANKPVADQEIIEHPFTFKVRGNYHDLGAFFAKLSNYPNIVNIKGLHLSRMQDNPAYSISSSFIVSVFTYKQPSDEELAAQLEAKKLERASKSGKGKKKRGKRGRK